jgi:protein-arginine kinase activator protein McsA
MAYGDDMQCNKCKVTKPKSEFFKESSCKRGYRYTCKECDAPRFKKYREENKKSVASTRLRWSRKTKYNFPQELYDERLNDQGGVCAICGTDNPGGRGQFHADHNHSTNKPRGVLCHNCNVALGNFKDNPELLQKAIVYLNKYSEVN